MARPAEPPAVRPRVPLQPWLAALLGLVCFANTLFGGLTYDDRPLVLENPRIRTLSDFGSLWLSDWWGDLERAEQPPEALRDRLYRPLTLVTFALNYATHGPRPFGYHLFNVLLHAAAGVLVWHLARRLTGESSIATIAAVLFAVHPIHSEAVASVVGRAEILATILLLGGALVLLGGARPRPQRTAIAAFLFLLALLAKETAVCYPAIGLLLLLAHPADTRPRGGRTWLVHAAILLAPLVVYFPLRYVALDQHLIRAGSADPVMNPLAAATIGEHILGIFTVLGHYTRLMLVPAQLSSDYGKAIVDPARGVELMTIIGFIAAFALMAGLMTARRGSQRARQVAVLTAIFIASYVLISNSLLLIGVSLAERLLYWPSVPLLILAAMGIVEFARRQCAPGRPLAQRTSVLATLGILVIVALGVRTAVRNSDWSSNMALFTVDSRVHPTGVHLNHGAAIELVRLWRSHRPPTPDTNTEWSLARRHLLHLGIWQTVWSPEKQRAALLRGAEEHLNRALMIQPDFVDGLLLRGQVRRELGNVDGALRDIESVLLIEPDNQKARSTRNALRTTDARPTIALDDLAAVVATQPADVAARLELGATLLEQGLFDDARAHFEAIIAIDPDHVTALRELGKIYALTGEPEQARALFERVVELDPRDWQAHANLVQVIGETDPALALRHAERAYDLQPNDVRIAANLAEAYVLNDQIPRARQLYRQILQGLPANDPFAAMLADRLTELE